MVSRTIPEPIKRAVRQKCGFGCIICGAPIFQYDHHPNFSQVQKHEVSGIFLLCPAHHVEKTSSRLPASILEAAVQNPINLTREKTSAYRVLLGDGKKNIRLGGNQYLVNFNDTDGKFDAIRILGRTVVGIESQEGSLLLNLVLTDSYGATVLEVTQGELVLSTGVWDYKFEGKSIAIRSAPRKIEISLSILDDGVSIDKGCFVLGEIRLSIERDYHVIYPQEIKMMGCIIDGARIGLDVGSGSTRLMVRA